MSGNTRCRLCAIKLEDSINVFGEEGVKQDLSKKIIQCLQIWLFPDDVLPTTICGDCCSKVNLFFDFYHNCKKSQVLLMSIYQDQDDKSEACIFVKEFIEMSTAGVLNRGGDDDRNSDSKEDCPEYTDFVTLDEEVEEWHKWKCKICAQNFATRAKMREHRDEVHKQDRVYTCNHCNKSFTNYHNFIRHVKSHNNPKKKVSNRASDDAVLDKARNVNGQIQSDDYLEDLVDPFPDSSSFTKPSGSDQPSSSRKHTIQDQQWDDDIEDLDDPLSDEASITRPPCSDVTLSSRKHIIQDQQWDDDIEDLDYPFPDNSSITRPPGSYVPSSSIEHTLQTEDDEESADEVDEKLEAISIGSGEEDIPDVDDLDQNGVYSYDLGISGPTHTGSMVSRENSIVPDAHSVSDPASTESLPPSPKRQRMQNSIELVLVKEEHFQQSRKQPPEQPMQQHSENQQEPAVEPLTDFPIQTPWEKVYPPEPPKEVASKFIVLNSGPNCPSSTNPIHYFSLFFTDAMWDLIVSETNKYAGAKIASLRASGKLASFSHLYLWTDVTTDEVKIFIALLLLMGLNSREHVTDYWSQHPVLHIPFYFKTMSLKRFQLILTMFQLSSCASSRKSQPGNDPWVKIRKFIDRLNRSFKCYFTPNQEVSIEESMVGMKNGVTFIQCVSNKKHSRFGIKKFDLCDSSTKYVLQSVLYSGEDFLCGDRDPFTHKVVKHLLSQTGLLRKGHHLFTDNFYTSVQMCRWLRSENTFLTGIINGRNKELSKIVMSAVLGVGQSVYFRKKFDSSDSILLVKHQEHETGKPLHLISTACHAEDVKLVSSSGNQHIKPLTFSVFNRFMGDVDSRDRSMYHVSCKRSTSKYWRKIVFNFIDMALQNAYILYKEQNEQAVSRFDFITNVIKTLCVSSKMSSVSPAVRVPYGDISNTRHCIKKLPHTKVLLCVVCNDKGKKIRSSYWCPGCNVGVHVKCFEQFDHSPSRVAGRRFPLPK